MKISKLIVVAAALTVAVSSCGAAKQAGKTERMSKEVLLRTDSIAHVMPSFMGGTIETFRQWCQLRVIYPQNLFDGYLNGNIREEALTGTVLAAFAVEADGSVRHVHILSSPNRYFDREVERIIIGSSPWTPGYNQNGEPVRVLFFLPVNFTVERMELNILRNRRTANLRRSRF